MVAIFDGFFADDGEQLVIFEVPAVNYITAGYAHSDQVCLQQLVELIEAAGREEVLKVVSRGRHGLVEGLRLFENPVGSEGLVQVTHQGLKFW